MSNKKAFSFLSGKYCVQPPPAMDVTNNLEIQNTYTQLEIGQNVNYECKSGYVFETNKALKVCINSDTINFDY
jgi:hypothetical protein